MLQSGDQFISGKTGGVACAFFPWHGAHMGVAPAHIFRYSGTDILRIGNQKTRISYFAPGADIAFFPVMAACRTTMLSQPSLGEASFVNRARIMGCRVTDVSWSIAYVMLQPRNLPGPGDSGTPLVQDGNVVGMLITMNLGTCKGTVITGNFLKQAEEEFIQREGQ